MVMKCSQCDQDATVFLTKVEGDDLKKLIFCEDCAKNNSLMEQEGAPPTLSEVMSQLPSTIDGELEELECECGFTMENLTKTGRLGCSQCYETFSKIIDIRISSLHKDDVHTGKSLELPQDKISIEKRINKVKSALETAIKDEDFEKAAHLRDEISEMKKKLILL